MKVLLAEDSLTMRRLLSSQLQRWEFDVVEAENGAEAWNAFQQHNFDMVLTDWMMPEVDGLELTRRIRAADVRSSDQTPYVYIVLLTARSENENLMEAMEAGADDFLGKPCNPKELRVRLAAGKRILDLEHSLIDRNHRLMEAQAALIQTEKLAGVGQLAAGMAHEINNPLSVILQNIQNIYRRCSTDINRNHQVAQELGTDLNLIKAYLNKRDFFKFLDSMKAAGDDAITIINNMLEFSKRSVRLKQRVDIAQLCKDCFQLVKQNQILKTMIDLQQIKVSIAHPKEAIVLNCSKSEIQQVIVNLLKNAIQAIDEKNKQQATSGGLVSITLSCETNIVQILICDEGIGMSHSTMTRLFEPFYTTKAGSGNGLGLAVCYSIITHHHSGSIDVQSKPNQGSTFKIRLPMHVSSHAAEPDKKLLTQEA